MAAPKTGILAMLASSPKSKGGSEKSGPPALGGDEASGEVGDALLEMFDALKAGDGSGAELAFKRAKEACEDDYEADEDMDEEATDTEEL